MSNDNPSPEVTKLSAAEVIGQRIQDLRNRTNEKRGTATFLIGVTTGLGVLALTGELPAVADGALIAAGAVSAAGAYKEGSEARESSTEASMLTALHMNGQYDELRARELASEQGAGLQSPSQPQ